MSEASLRRCGSTGTWTGGACLLDIALFPLFGYLLMDASETPRGCAALWPYETTIAPLIVMSTERHVEDIGDSALTGVPRGQLLCATDGCLYAERFAGSLTDTLTDANVNDFVAGVATSLNAIATSATSRVQARFRSFSALSIYEDIVMCQASVSVQLGMSQVAPLSLAAAWPKRL